MKLWAWRIGLWAVVAALVAVGMYVAWRRVDSGLVREGLDEGLSAEAVAAAEHRALVTDLAVAGLCGAVLGGLVYLGTRSYRSLSRLGRGVLYVVLSLGAAVTLVPLVWLVTSSLKNQEDFFLYTWLPPLERLSLDNFRNLSRQMPFLRLMMNTLFVTGVTVLVQLFFASLGGFALARYEFRGKRLAMIVMLGTLLIPSQVMLAPLYELITRMHLADSYWGLIVPGAVSVFGMLLFRQSMLQLPDDLLQAGRIDGCSEFGLYWRIAIPIQRPMIGAFCLIAFMATWNNFLWPQIILQSREKFTLPIALNQLVGLQHQDYGVLMAGTLLSIIPVVVLFFVLQREFLSGLTAGAVKG